MIDLLNSFFFRIGKFLDAGNFSFGILLLISFVGIWKKKQKLVFLYILPVTIIFYLILGGSSRRYLLNPIIVSSGAIGLSYYVLYQFIKVPLRKIHCHFRLFVIILTAIVVGINITRFMWKERKTVFSEITATIKKNQTSDSIIIGVACPDIKRLHSFFSGNESVRIYDCGSWNNAISILTDYQIEDRDIFFVVKYSYKENPYAHKEAFRESFSIYPFEEMVEIEKQKRKYLLLKFNKKVLASNADRTVFEKTESIPRIVEQQDSIKNFMISGEIFKDPVAEDVYVATNGTFICDRIFMRPVDRPQNNIISFTVHNALYWPLFKTELAFSEKGEKDKANMEREKAQVFAGSLSSEDVSLLPNEEQPLFLAPNEVVLFDDPALAYSIENCIPLWSKRQKRFSVTVEDSPDNALCVQINDDAIHTFLRKSIPSLCYKAANDRTNLANKKVLFLENRDFDILRLKSFFSPQILPEKNVVSLEIGSKNKPSIEYSFADSNSESVDVAIVNCFLDLISRPLRLPFFLDTYLNNQLPQFLNRINKKFNVSDFLFIIPPPPASDYSLYALNGSPQFYRLSHYKTCSAIQRWANAHHEFNVKLVPLYFYCDPYNDYTISCKYMDTSISSGYSFTDDAKKKYCQILMRYIDSFE